MNVRAPETFIPTMVDRIVEGFRPARIVLFGSHARGTETKWSDVDLLVIIPNVVDKRDTTIETRRALGDLPVCKDIVVATREEATRRGTLAAPCCVRLSAKGGSFMNDPEILNGFTTR